MFKIAKTPEGQFQDKVIKYLKTIEKCWYVKVWGGGFQKSGIPDLICCINGKFIALELKAANGKPSKLQEYNINKIKKCGGIGYILYPHQFEDFKKEVEEICKT